MLYILLNHKDCNYEVWKIIVHPSFTATLYYTSGALSVPYSCLPHMTPLSVWGSYHWDALTGLSTASYSTAAVNTLIPLTHTQLIYELLYCCYYEGISILCVRFPENIVLIWSLNFVKKIEFFYLWYAFQHFDISENSCNKISVTQKLHD